MSTEAPRLRGATVNTGRGLRPRTWRLILIVALVLTALVNVLSWRNDNQRYQRLSTSGIAVIVHVGTCTGNLGGSGSNGAGFTCTGSYVVDGQSLTATIAAEADFLAPGTSLLGTVDPSHHGFVVATAGLGTLKASTIALWPSALVVLAIIFVFAVVRRRGCERPEQNVS